MGFLLSGKKNEVIRSIMINTNLYLQLSLHIMAFKSSNFEKRNIVILIKSWRVKDLNQRLG